MADDRSPTTNRRPDWTAMVSLAVTLVALWFLLSGHYSFSHPLLLGLGAASVALVVLLMRRMRLVDSENMPFHLLPRIFPYLPWIGWQIVVSSFDVLRRAFAPELLEPHVIKIRGGQATDFGLVTYANSITLTPGTTSLDSDVDENTITVHVISEDSHRSLARGEMDRRVRRVEGPPT